MMRIRLLLISLLFIVNSCSSVKIDKNEVLELDVFSLPKYMETNNSITSPEELFRWHDDASAHIICRDTILSNPTDVERFISGVNRLKKRRGRQSIDIRKVVVVKMKDGTCQIFSFGDFFSILHDTYYCRPEKALFDFLDEKIYLNHSLGYWVQDCFQDVECDCP